MDTKQIGMLLIAISAVMGVLSYQFINEISMLKHDACPLKGTETCPFEHTLVITPEGYLSILVTVATFCLGVYLALFRQPVFEKKKPKVDAKLDKEEQNIIDLLLKSDGTIFQSELVEKTGITKVRVTRVLDKLEGKGIIERKRRGMTNVVVLKQ